MKTRLPAVIVVCAAVCLSVAAIRFSPDRYDPEVKAEQQTWVPAASDDSVLTQTWFCPGIPATGEGVGGVFRITNRLGTPATGTILLYNDQSNNVRLDLSIPKFDVTEIDVASTLPGTITSAVIEIEGGGTLAEQVASTPNGNSLAACSNTTNTDWYFADGFTVDDSTDRLLLSNPYDQAVVAELTFAVADGARDQAAYRTMPIPARSVRIVDLGTPGGGAQDEPLLAAHVHATRGQLVVGRVAEFAGGGRAGTQVSLAASTLSDQWRFAGGNKAEGFSDRYTIYNPTDSAVTVEPVVLGNPTAIIPDDDSLPSGLASIEVEAGRVVEFVPADIEQFPDGEYAIVFSTLSKPSIVIERATTRTIGKSTNTSVILGTIARPSDQLLATQWQVPKAPDDALTDALVIHNLDLQKGSVTIFAIGPDGPKEVPSLTNVELPEKSGILRLPLEDAAVIGRPFLVQSSNRIAVERWYRSGRGDTRTVAWAFPTG